MVRSGLRAVPLAVALLVIGACGGGGGGVPASQNSLAYTTDWTMREAPSGGDSQRLTLLDPGALDVVFRTVNIERTSNALQTVPIDGLEDRVYLLKLELFAQPNQAGGVKGVIETLVHVSGRTAFSTVVGTAPTAVQVVPAAVSLTVGDVLRFRAVGKTGGVHAFTAPGGFAWTEEAGHVGRLEPDGVLYADQQGNATIRARLTALGISGTASVSVSAVPPAKWTILVFLNAANDLYRYSELNVGQMERAAGNPGVQVVVQWKQSRSLYADVSFDGTRRYVLRPSGRELIQDLGTGVDMGSPQTLRAFVDWAIARYPAQRYGIVVWNHGNGWRRRPERPQTRAVSYDKHTGNAIQIWELPAALGARRFDFLAWDASLMQMIEVAYELRSNADYVVGSEESPPAEGYPYEPIFAGFRDRPDDPTPSLVRGFVDHTLAVPAYANRKISQSVVETSKLDGLEAALDEKTARMIALGAPARSIFQNVRVAAQAYSQTGARYYRDLADVATRIEALSSDAQLDAACALVRQRLAEAVVWEGHNAQSAGSRGLAIDMTPGDAFMSQAADYGRMRFGKDCLWDDWLATTP